MTNITKLGIEEPEDYSTARWLRWFNCLGCFWFERTGNTDMGYCLSDPGGVDTMINSRCRFWVCLFCGEDWTENDDHSECDTFVIIEC